MKKLILIIILFFNLIPILKKGELSLAGLESAFADTYGGENGNYESLYDSVSDLYGLDIVGSDRDANGMFYFVLEGGGIFNPHDMNFTGEQVENFIENFPEYEPPIPVDDENADEILDDFFDWLDEMPDEEPAVPDCSEADQAAGAAATNLFNNTAVQDALGDIPHMDIPPLGFPPNEESFFYIDDDNGVIDTSPLETLGPTGGSPSDPPNANAKGEVHTHPNSGNRPSAADIYRLGTISVGEGYTMYVPTADGTVYALVITNSQKLSDFMDFNSSFLGSDNSFNNTSIAGADYYIGLSQTGSQAHALDYALKNLGISLLKQYIPPQTARGFYKLNVEEKIDNGVIVLEKKDCN